MLVTSDCTNRPFSNPEACGCRDQKGNKERVTRLYTSLASLYCLTRAFQIVFVILSFVFVKKTVSFFGASSGK